MTSRIAVVVLAGLFCAGCWNGYDSIHVNLGSVSLGQQLIDLKSAHDQGVISDAEFERLRELLVSIDEYVTRRDQGED